MSAHMRDSMMDGAIVAHTFSYRLPLGSYLAWQLPERELVTREVRT